MKKKLSTKLELNKSKISSIQENTIKGGILTINVVCTSTLPGSIINCDNRPSEFGAGGCTYEQTN